MSLIKEKIFTLILLSVLILLNTGTVLAKPGTPEQLHPQTPESFIAVDNNTFRIDLYWDIPDDSKIDGFYVYASSSQTSFSSQPTAILDPDDDTYYFYNHTPSIEWHFKIVSFSDKYKTESLPAYTSCPFRPSSASISLEYLTGGIPYFNLCWVDDTSINVIHQLYDGDELIASIPAYYTSSYPVYGITPGRDYDELSLKACFVNSDNSISLSRERTLPDIDVPDTPYILFDPNSNFGNRDFTVGNLTDIAYKTYGLSANDRCSLAIIRSDGSEVLFMDNTLDPSSSDGYLTVRPMVIPWIESGDNFRFKIYCEIPERNMVISCISDDTIEITNYNRHVLDGMNLLGENDNSVHLSMSFNEGFHFYSDGNVVLDVYRSLDNDFSNNTDPVYSEPIYSDVGGDLFDTNGISLDDNEYFYRFKFSYYAYGCKSILPTVLGRIASRPELSNARWNSPVDEYGNISENVSMDIAFDNCHQDIDYDCVIHTTHDSAVTNIHLSGDEMENEVYILERDIFDNGFLGVERGYYSAYVKWQGGKCTSYSYSGSNSIVDFPVIEYSNHSTVPYPDGTTEICFDFDVSGFRQNGKKGVLFKVYLLQQDQSETYLGNAYANDDSELAIRLRTGVSAEDCRLKLVWEDTYPDERIQYVCDELFTIESEYSPPSLSMNSNPRDICVGAHDTFPLSISDVQPNSDFRVMVKATSPSGATFQHLTGDIHGNYTFNISIKPDGNFSDLYAHLKSEDVILNYLNNVVTFTAYYYFDDHIGSQIPFSKQKVIRAFTIDFNQLNNIVIGQDYEYSFEYRMIDIYGELIGGDQGVVVGVPRDEDTTPLDGCISLYKETTNLPVCLLSSIGPLPLPTACSYTIYENYIDDEWAGYTNCYFEVRFYNLPFGLSYIESARFSIVAPSLLHNPFININNSSCVCFSNDNTIISWESSEDIENVDIIMVKEREEVVIQENYPNIGSYTWVVKTDKEEDVRIRIESADDPKIFDVTEGEYRLIPEQELSLNVHPNPFNNISNFKFFLFKSEDVNLNIFDVLGREVKTLCNGTMDRGYNTVTFEANNLAGGVYFYVLKTESAQKTGKILYLK